ncbi:MAG: hypothetical protein ACO1OC_03185 [Tuberibacillus sp.]
MAWHQILSVLSFIFLAIGVLSIYKLQREIKTLDRNKTIEEAGIERVMKRYYLFAILWNALGLVIYLVNILLYDI